MRFGIVGGGGIGGYLAARLMAAGEDVALMARGAHLGAIRERGLILIDPDGDLAVTPSVSDDPSVLEGADVIVLAVKAHQMADAISQIAPVVGPTTRIVPFQNGVDAPDMLAETFGEDRAWVGSARIFVNITGPATITRYGVPKGFVFGTFCGTQDDLIVAEAMRRFRAAGIDAADHGDARIELWTKFVMFNAFSSLTAATRKRFGELRECAETVALARRLIREGIDVAVASGIPLPDNTFDDVLNVFLNVLPDEGRTSTAHDLELGRSLEIDFTCGAVARRGRALGVDVTASETIHAILAPWKDGIP